MALVKPIFSLRSANHLNTRLQLRDEKAYATRLIPWLALVNISFSVVDWVLSKNLSFLAFLGIRVLAVVTSWGLFLLSRGRLRYGIRLLFIVGPYLLCVQYVMITQGFSFTPYMAGLALVMVTSTTLFPAGTRVALEQYTISVLPLIVWALFISDASATDRMNVVLMTLGSVFVCSVNSGQVYRDLRDRLKAQEALVRHLGKSEAQVRRKAEQLLKRRTFESQFSPQVVDAVLTDPGRMSGRAQRELVVVVLDIEDSTGKATTLPGTQYDEVVEEVYDVFASACLQWNVTVDKFTGDGGMAFAGAPVAGKDDFRRALMACKEVTRMLRARRDKLDALWQEPLNIRMALVEGVARVGFIGRGTLKAYTAVGEVVSFTHRLAAVPSPWCIAAFSFNNPAKLEESYPDFNTEPLVVAGLKGFGGRSFMAKLFSPIGQAKDVMDAGRCADCGTPLIFEEDPQGLPKVVCPGCRSRASARAA